MEHPGIDGRGNEVISCSDGVNVTSEVQIKLQKSRSHISLLTFQHPFYSNQINPHIKANGQLMAVQLVENPDMGRSWIHKLLSSEETVVSPNWHVQEQQTPYHRDQQQHWVTDGTIVSLNREQGVQWSNPTLCLYPVPVSAVITLNLLQVGSCQYHASFGHLLKIINSPWKPDYEVLVMSKKLSCFTTL